MAKKSTKKRNEVLMRLEERKKTRWLSNEFLLPEVLMHEARAC
jgi:hypothetical protein